MAHASRNSPVAQLAPSGSELGTGDVLVATTKQDCGGSCNPSEHGQMGVTRLPRYAWSSHVDVAALRVERDRAADHR